MDENAIIHAFILDGQGGGQRLSLQELMRWTPADGTLWAHLDLRASGVTEWLRDETGLDPVITEALISEDPRPRILAVKDGLLAILRGVNFNPGADPEDMVSVRCWLEGKRVLTLRHRRVMAVRDVGEAVQAGDGPSTTGELLVAIIRGLLDRASNVVSELSDAIDALEDRVVSEGARELRPELADLRRQAITLRRYLAPQRDVMTRLPFERMSWLSELDRARLREEGERIARFVEDIDANRERAAVTQEELTNRLAEQTNRTMYILSLVAAIFLPLGLLTGLLGINVGGIPGTESPWAFTVVSVGIVGLAIILIAAFRRLHWL